MKTTKAYEVELGVNKVVDEVVDKMVGGSWMFADANVFRRVSPVAKS